MKKIIAALLLSIVLLPVFAQAYEHENLTVLRPGGTPGSYEINFKDTIRNGDVSYLPINTRMDPDKAGTVTLAIINQFRNQNPELTITDWKPIYGASAEPNTYISLIGIYIDHKTK